MKNIEENNRSLKEDIKLIGRGLKVFSDNMKYFFTSKNIHFIFLALSPFVNIYFSAQIINELTGARNQDRLVKLVIITVVCNLIISLCNRALQRWSEHCESARWQIMHNLYTKKTLNMDYDKVENPEFQSKLSTCIQHNTGMGFGINRVIWPYSGIFIGVIQIIISITMAFTLFTLKVPEDSPLGFLNSPIANIAIIIVLIISIVVPPIVTKWAGKIWHEASKANNIANRLFGFYYFTMPSSNGRAKDIRIYAQDNFMKESIESQNDGDDFYRFSSSEAKKRIISTVVSNVCNGCIYLFAVLKAFGGAFGIGSILQYVGVIKQFSNGFISILDGTVQLINNNPFLAKFFDIMDTPSDKNTGTRHITKGEKNTYEIEFHNVCFKYPSLEEYSLKNFNLKLTVGKRLAVVGMNGSGKTTMIKLLCRLYDPTEGFITLNGVNIKEYDYKEYLSIFGIVFQDFQLLPFSIGQNISSSVDFDRDKALECLEKSGMSERLKTLPKGLDTLLYKNFDDDGVDISGGEAQKIALARALYKDAPFIVLDEPTAALDPIAEYEIYSKFNEIVGDRTAIYISHRLSSCRFCHDIAVFDKGQLIQQGSHEQLLEQEDGKYHELWTAQAQYYE